MKREHHAGKKCNENHYSRGLGANIEDLGNNFPGLLSVEYVDTGKEEKDCCRSQIVDKGHHWPSKDAEKPGDDLSYRVKYEDIGLRDYKETWDYQAGIFDGLTAAKKQQDVLTEGTEKKPGTLIFVEHPHVFTLGYHQSEAYS